MHFFSRAWIFILNYFSFISLKINNLNTILIGMNVYLTDFYIMPKERVKDCNEYGKKSNE